MADKSRGKYLSLRQYEGPFQVPRIYTIPTPDDDRYTIEEVMKIMKKAMSDKDKMYNKMQQTIGRLFYPPHNSIAWIIKTMEELQQKLDYTEWIIQRQQYHITKSEKAIKSFVVHHRHRSIVTSVCRSTLASAGRNEVSRRVCQALSVELYDVW
ncbi:hypothetical protein F2Q70_00029632 [Brassica cretica]|uniref:Uncharacterized protein n=1 Tax=Brassica cretica TaxID=69181 RepID=A0A3N6Q0N8_BRACR|nr:hypothetical protein F2Q70_00029632 [Brassica cretica]KAF3594733.1 hypothetical protein DY000_02021466 [Brassica cretica]